MRSRGLRRFALVTGMVAAVSPAAAAAASPTTGTTTTVTHHTSSGHAPRASASQRMITAVAAAPSAEAAGRVWLAAQSRSALAQFMPDDPAFAAAVSAEAAGSPGTIAPVSAPLATAGDFTGSGQPVVLDFNAAFVRGVTRFGITARSGQTGEAVWARRVGSASHLVVPLSLSSLGGGLGGELLLLDVSSSQPSKDHATLSLRIEAWSGKTGKTLWRSTPVTGTSVQTGRLTTETTVPGFPSVLNAFPGSPLDALIPTVTGTFTTNDPEQGPGSGSAVLVSGRDGATSSPYPTLTSSINPPTFQKAPDLSGDRLADVVAIVPGSSGSITALRGNTGATIWSDDQPVDEFDQIKSVGPLDGPIADLFIEGQQVTLVNGADGKVLWVRRGFVEAAVRLGPVRPGHARAVALVSDFAMGSQSSNGKGHESGIVDIRAVTAANQVVWHRRVVATIRTDAQTSHVEETATARPIGDVQPDGTIDFAVRAIIGDGHRQIRKVGLVNGRNGGFRRHPMGRRIAGSLVRGLGTDFVDAAASSHGIVLSGFDGVTGTRLVQATVATPGHVRRPFVAGVQASGHRCSDVELGGIYRPHHVVVEVVSASGVGLWSLRFGRHQLTGGHLVTYKGPRRFCAK